MAEDSLADVLAEERLRSYIERANNAAMEPAPRVERSAAEGLAASRRFVETMAGRRTIRHYTDEPVAWELIENAVRAAGGAPSGANQQPWTYVIVSDPALKVRMREAIEREERATYARRASPEWLDALAHLGTDWHKEHITTAPFIAVVFAQVYGVRATDAGVEEKIKHYYVHESVGISVGFFLAALTHAGLSTLTHTPNPMGFLAELLGRPANERCYVVIPIGYPAADARVPAIKKRALDEILVRI